MYQTVGISVNLKKKQSIKTTPQTPFMTIKKKKRYIYFLGNFRYFKSGGKGKKKALTPLAEFLSYYKICEVLQ